jgi:hypothetical protein
MELTDALAAHLLRLGGEYRKTDPTDEQARMVRFERVTLACETAVACGLPIETHTLVNGVLRAVNRDGGPITGGPSEWLAEFRTWWDSPVPAADDANDATPDDMVPELDDADDVPTSDNTITAPNGTPLLDRYGFPVRTVKAAERKFIEAATVQQAWTDRHLAGLVDVYGMTKAASAWSSTATRMLEALAHKRGGVTDDNMDAVEAELKPRLDKAIAKWRAEHPNHE